jgi:hypothetical protein
LEEEDVVNPMEASSNSRFSDSNDTSLTNLCGTPLLELSKKYNNYHHFNPEELLFIPPNINITEKEEKKAAINILKNINCDPPSYILFLTFLNEDN